MKTYVIAAVVVIAFVACLVRSNPVPAADPAPAAADPATAVADTAPAAAEKQPPTADLSSVSDRQLFFTAGFAAGENATRAMFLAAWRGEFNDWTNGYQIQREWMMNHLRTNFPEAWEQVLKP
jgi:hypothetical protein